MKREMEVVEDVEDDDDEDMVDRSFCAGGFWWLGLGLVPPPF